MLHPYIYVIYISYIFYIYYIDKHLISLSPTWTYVFWATFVLLWDSCWRLLYIEHFLWWCWLKNQSPDSSALGFCHKLDHFQNTLLNFYHFRYSKWHKKWLNVPSQTNCCKIGEYSGASQLLDTFHPLPVWCSFSKIRHFMVSKALFYILRNKVH